MRRGMALAAAMVLVVTGCALGDGVFVSPSAAPAADDAPAPTTPLVASSLATTTLPPTTTTIAATTTTVEDRSDFLRSVGANEAGRIMVLEYHLIEEPEDDYSRTPANFRRDVERLIAGGYYPMTVRDLATGMVAVPAGKTPVVLTFDDSSSGQCRFRDDGTPDPLSACGMLVDAAARHPGAWAPIATFNVLLDVDVDDRVLFGQPGITREKLTQMVAWGMEIGSHTISHFNLSLGTPEQIQWQLGTPETVLESLIPGYEVDTLATPFGVYPEDEALLVGGEWEGEPYDYIAVLEVSGGPSISPHHAEFDPIHIDRIIATDEDVDAWFAYYEANPDERYVSDGDPMTVSVPEDVAFVPSGDLPDGVRVVRY